MKKLILLLGFLFLISCSHKIIQPFTSTWQQIPCEYRLTGDDLSILNVRAPITEFDSVKIVMNSLMWTVPGDTLSHKTASYPDHYKVIDNYIVFILMNQLPRNSILRSVELWIKK